MATRGRGGARRGGARRVNKSVGVAIGPVHRPEMGDEGAQCSGKGKTIEMSKISVVELNKGFRPTRDGPSGNEANESHGPNDLSHISFSDENNIRFLGEDVALGCPEGWIDNGLANQDKSQVNGPKAIRPEITAMTRAPFVKHVTGAHLAPHQNRATENAQNINGKGRAENSKGSWADKVKASSAKSRYCLDGSFLQDHGQAEYSLPDELIEENFEDWTRCLVGFIPGVSYPFYAARAIALREWKQFGIESVTPYEGFFLFRFQNVEKLQDVLAEGPWLFGGKFMVLQQWHPCFVFDKSRIDKVPVWIRLKGLPFTLWSHKALSYVASIVGKPLSCDRATHERSRLSFARVCVEVDASKPYVHNFILKCKLSSVPLRIGVDYEWKPKRCPKCCVYGHKCETEEKLGMGKPSKEGPNQMAKEVQSEDSKLGLIDTLELITKPVSYTDPMCNRSMGLGSPNGMSGGDSRIMERGESSNGSAAKAELKDLQVSANGIAELATTVAVSQAPVNEIPDSSRKLDVIVEFPKEPADRLDKDRLNTDEGLSVNKLGKQQLISRATQLENLVTNDETTATTNEEGVSSSGCDREEVFTTPESKNNGKAKTHVDGTLWSQVSWADKVRMSPLNDKAEGSTPKVDAYNLRPQRPKKTGKMKRGRRPPG